MSLFPISHLTPSHIQSLSEVQKTSYLLSLLSQKHQDSLKHKHIHKVLNKSQLRNKIKKQMQSAVQKKYQEKSKELVESELERERIINREKGGKLKFKSGTRSIPHPHIHRFNNQVSKALSSSCDDQLTCSICLELLVCPSLTYCGHTFCYQCIDESLIFSSGCPNCRENIKGCDPIVCPLLSNVIQHKLQLKNQSNELQTYQQRVLKFHTWKQERMLDGTRITKGMAIDVKDTEYIWCQGNIVDIYRKWDRYQGKEIVEGILVHYNRWNKIYNQIIDFPSNRLAPSNYFTSRVDIPRYNLAQEEGNMRGSVVTGVVFRQPIQVNFIHILQSDENSSSPQLQSNNDQVEEQENSEHLSHLAPEEEQVIQNQMQQFSSESEESISQPRGLFGGLLRRLIPRYRGAGEVRHLERSVPEENNLEQDQQDENMPDDQEDQMMMRQPVVEEQSYQRMDFMEEPNYSQGYESPAYYERAYSDELNLFKQDSVVQSPGRLPEFND